jgi:uncharacterized protein (AIM24 family)
VEFTKKFSTGLFGGEGFVLQGLTGTGDVMVKAGGALIRKNLKAGEVLRISSGCLVGFQEGVEFGKRCIQRMNCYFLSDNLMCLPTRLIGNIM